MGAFYSRVVCGFGNATFKFVELWFLVKLCDGIVKLILPVLAFLDSYVCVCVDPMLLNLTLLFVELTL